MKAHCSALEKSRYIRILCLLFLYQQDAKTRALHVRVDYGAILDEAGFGDNQNNNPIDGLSLETKDVNESSSNRIVGGSDTTRNEYPWFVGICPSTDCDFRFFCGGSLVAPSWVLTAAHCYLENQLTAVVNATEHGLNHAGGIPVAVVEKVVHPLYSVDASGVLNYDYMLLRLEQPVEGIIPLSINADASEPVRDDLVVVLGLGSVDPFGFQYATILQKVQLNARDDAFCQSSYRNVLHPDIMFCAGGSEASENENYELKCNEDGSECEEVMNTDNLGRDACFGDSGSPILDESETIVLGVVSFGVGCATEIPGVYARASSAFDWIQEQLGNELGGTGNSHSMAPMPTPSSQPTSQPTDGPTQEPTSSPTDLPTSQPSTQEPTTEPTGVPTPEPTKNPTVEPTKNPTLPPSPSPTISPTSFPSHVPSFQPSAGPTEPPSPEPTQNPSLIPTSSPTTSSPTVSPTPEPTETPTLPPTLTPTLTPTLPPTDLPTSSPTVTPTISPTIDPTSPPTNDPTRTPTLPPTPVPTPLPTGEPTAAPINIGQREASFKGCGNAVWGFGTLETGLNLKDCKVERRHRVLQVTRKHESSSSIRVRGENHQNDRRRGLLFSLFSRISDDFTSINIQATNQCCEVKHEDESNYDGVKKEWVSTSTDADFPFQRSCLLVTVDGGPPSPTTSFLGYSVGSEFAVESVCDGCFISDVTFEYAFRTDTDDRVRSCQDVTRTTSEKSDLEWHTKVVFEGTGNARIFPISLTFSAGCDMDWGSDRIKNSATGGTTFQASSHIDPLYTECDTQNPFPPVVNVPK